MTLPQQVRIVEVGPRDGLQNEPIAVSTADKLAFIHGLVAAGHRDIEVTSFVHPAAVPQLADAEDVLAGLPEAPDVTFSALVPNERGLSRALNAEVKRIAVFIAASETFSQKNIRMSISESLNVCEKVVPAALAEGVSVRGYLSTCFVCPYEGEIGTAVVCELTKSLLDFGVDEVSISDTIGAAAPTDVRRTLEAVLSSASHDALALHFHDTYGTALANVVAGLDMGITTYDASAGGLGGCPFAPGASGNLATEDLVYLLQRMGIECGVSLSDLAKCSLAFGQVLGKPLPSKQLSRLSQQP